MKNSYHLTQAKPPKFWFTPLIWGTFLIFLSPSIVIMPFYSLLKLIITTPLRELYFNLFSFAAIILATILLVVFFHKRPIASLGFHKKDFFKQYGTGLLIGTACFLFTILAGLVTGTLTIALVPQINWIAIFIFLLGFMVQGLAEEVVSRGYVQNGLCVKVGFVGAMVLQGLFFAALHGMNDGMSFLPILNLFLFSIFIGTLFHYTDSLWMVGAVHSIWNFLQGPVLGIEVSGTKIPETVFTSTFKGAELLTGGKFGMEGSIFTTLAMLIGTLLVYLVYTKQQTKK